MKQTICSLVFPFQATNFCKFGIVYPTRHGFAAIEAGYGSLRLRYVVVKETLSLWEREEYKMEGNEEHVDARVHNDTFGMAKWQGTIKLSIIAFMKIEVSC